MKICGYKYCKNKGRVNIIAKTKAAKASDTSKDEAVAKGKGRVSDAWSDGADADFANDIAADDDGRCVFLVFFELP